MKGLVIAVDRRNGFEDAGTGAGGGAGEIELVEIGGSEGGPTDVGLPPGVSARVRDMPIPLWLDSVSTECEWGIATGVAFLDRDVSRVGVAELAWRKVAGSRWECGIVEVREGRRVEESVLRPVGVSSAVAYDVRTRLQRSV